MGYSWSIRVGGQSPFFPFCVNGFHYYTAIPLELKDKETFSQPVQYKPVG